MDKTSQIKSIFVSRNVIRCKYGAIQTQYKEFVRVTWLVFTIFNYGFGHFLWEEYGNKDN
jgi:hypothetical protein